MTPTPEKDGDSMTGLELDFAISKKRTGEDAAEYPRRRATIAVSLGLRAHDVQRRPDHCCD